jgi:hypothetical protein
VVDPTLLPNAGLARPLTVRAREGSVLNCVAPAAVNARLSTCQRVVDLIHGALAQAVPERLTAAHNGACFVASFVGRQPATGEPWVYLETIGGGFGALALRFMRPTVIAATAALGGYSAVRAVGSFVGNYPDEFRLVAQLENGAKLPTTTYGYLAGAGAIESPAVRLPLVALAALTDEYAAPNDGLERPMLLPKAPYAPGACPVTLAMSALTPPAAFTAATRNITLVPVVSPATTIDVAVEASRTSGVQSPEPLLDCTT